MEKHIPSINQLFNQRGVTALIVASMMVVFLGLAALAVDVGFTLVTRNQLQNVSDAGSLAATRKLGSIYEGKTYTEQQIYVCNPDDIVPVAQAVALENAAAGKNITVNGADVMIGQWKKDPADNKMKLFETLNQPDAVRVIARRDSTALSLEGPITTFFAKIFGINTLDVRAGATAALTGQSTAGEGDLPIPVGISKARFESPYCDREIHFYPTNDPLSCGGWHTYTGDTYPPNAGQKGLPKLLNDLKDGRYASPAAKTGTVFTFTGGTLASVFDEMKALFDTNKIPDATSPSGYSWTASVAVYDSEDCSNPNPGDTLRVIGFAEITITAVLEAPQKIIEGVIKCDYVAPDSRGGGGEYGTKGSIPGLVE